MGTDDYIGRAPESEKRAYTKYDTLHDFLGELFFNSGSGTGVFTYRYVYTDKRLASARPPPEGAERVRHSGDFASSHGGYTPQVGR